MNLNPTLHVDPITVRDPSMAPYIAASTIGKMTAGEYRDDADEVLSTDTAEALREAAKKRADTYDEEDPQSNRVPLAPMGLLAIHLLNMKNFDQNATDEDLSDTAVRFKLLISIADIYKETGLKKGTHKHVREKDKVVNVLVGVTVDEVKHFPLTVPQQLSDPKNVLRLELCSFSAHDDPPTNARIIGMVEVHLHEIIQAMMIIDVLPLSLNNKQVANLYVEFAFMYGALGFHYSTQLENAAFNASRDLSRTMLPRLALPPDRDGEVLTPVPQHPPGFIPWTCPVSTHWQEALRRAPEGPVPAAPASFGRRVRREMRRILDEYVPLGSRGDRLAFLSRLVRGAPGPGQSADCAGSRGTEGESKPPPGPGDRPASRSTGPDQRPTDTAPDKDQRPAAGPPDQQAQPRQAGGSPMPTLARVLAAAAAPAYRDSVSSSTLRQQPSQPADPEPPLRGTQRTGSSAARIAAPKQIRRAPLRRPAGDSSPSVYKAESIGTEGTADAAVDISH